MSSSQPVIVMVHGMWVGRKFMEPLAQTLRSRGCRVENISLTGLGDRIEENHPEVTLSTHIQDVISVIEAEHLESLTLIGYSYGGVVVTGVLETIPEKISQLIYLDALVPESAQSVSDLVPDFVTDMAELAQKEGDGWRVPYPWGKASDGVTSPHPLKTLLEPVPYGNPDAVQVPKAYLRFCRLRYRFTRALDRALAFAKEAGWPNNTFPRLDHLSPSMQPEAAADAIMTVMQAKVKTACL